MINPEDIEGIVKNAEDREFSGIFKRMDDDYKGIWEMGLGAYTDAGRAVEQKTKKHGTELEVASNDLRVFSDRVQAKLVSSEMQIRIPPPESEGQDKRDDMAKLERLLYFAFEKADERLISLVLPRLKTSIVWHGAVRGWQIGRFLVYKQGGNVVFDFMALDPRWTTYRLGRNGLKWVNYKTFKSSDDLKEEYNYSPSGFNLFMPWRKAPSQYPFYDFMEQVDEGKYLNSLVCQKTVLHQETLKIPSMPFAIVPIATRPPVVNEHDDSGTALKGYGDSIFAPNRAINEIRNRFASIVLTWAGKLARKPVINYKTDQGRSITDMFDVPGGVLELTKGENVLEPAPISEISDTIIGELNWLNEQMSQGMLSKINLGTPPPSGTAYNLAQEEGERVFNPQVRGLETFYATACRLIEEQLIAGGIAVKVTGENEKERKYFEVKVKPVDLKVPHIIKVEITSDAPWRKMDTWQVAQMAKQMGTPDGYVNEFILKFPDPKGLDDLAAIELFEHSPKGAMAKAIVALMKRGGDNDAFLAQSIAADMDKMETQESMEASGGAPPPPPSSEGAGI